MTKQEMRIAIAEACGWNLHYPAPQDLGIGKYLIRPPYNDGKHLIEQGIPAYVISTCDPTSSLWHMYPRLTYFQQYPAKEPRDNTSLIIPNYPEDLNAMHEAENTLDAEKLNYSYAHFLYNVVVPQEVQPFRAAAEKRAEAFLKTVGKWKE